MDRGGRLARPLTRTSRPRSAGAAGAFRLNIRIEVPIRLKRLVRRCLAPVRESGLPRGTGIAAAALFVLASVAYGTVRGDHVAEVAGELKDARDALASAVGFRVAQVTVTGRRLMTEKDILRVAGVTDRSSLLFLDVEGARARLQASPWIAVASVRKFYPGALMIDVDERAPFALWQKDGKISLIAADGTVLGPLGDKRFATLPLVVGPGAEKKARDFLAVLDRYPAIRDTVRASILVGERRWNLRLKNGIDVRLPEDGLEQGLDTLAALDRDKKLLTRDITAVDLRLPDRVSVRLSDAVAQAREEALKAKKSKGKGGSA